MHVLMVLVVRVPVLMLHRVVFMFVFMILCQRLLTENRQTGSDADAESDAFQRLPATEIILHIIFV